MCGRNEEERKKRREEGDGGREMRMDGTHYKGERNERR